MTRSLRRTLAVRFAITMGVGLSAAAAAAYRGTGRVMRHELDHGLAAAAFLLGAEALREPSLPLKPRVVSDPANYERDINRYLVLRDAADRVVGTVPGEAVTIPLDTAAARRARAGELVWRDDDWSGRPVRVLYRPAVGPAPGWVIQVAASLSAIQEGQRELLVVLVIVVVLGTGASFLGAWQLAASAVRPVGEITAQATRIEAVSLNRRIAAHADTEEYRELVAVLNRMLERLGQSFRAQQRFTAAASHELRTPLTALRGEVEVALRAPRSPEEYRRVLDSALEEIQSLTRLGEDLLFVSRAESVGTARRLPTDVNALVREALARARPAAADKRLRVEEHLTLTDGDVPLDAPAVSQLFARLVDNAIKFTPEGGRMVVETSAIPGGVRLAVEDGGPGIGPDDLPHVFEPFYRADQARSRGSGTGLGLAVAAAAARLHGGTIRAANLPAGGARFEADLMTASS